MCSPEEPRHTGWDSHDRTCTHVHREREREGEGEREREEREREKEREREIEKERERERERKRGRERKTKREIERDNLSLIQCSREECTYLYHGQVAQERPSLPTHLSPKQ